MTFRLRDYQERMIAETRVALRTHDGVLIQSPTGSGKTALSAYMMGSAAAKGRRAMFIVHRQELIEQSAKTFDQVGIRFGIIAAGYPERLYEPVQIASIDTLKRRLNRVPSPSLIVWDEAHHIGAAGWRAVKGHFSGAKHVGLSATPVRLDGTGLSECGFTHMVRGPSVSWLIQHGFLAPFKIFAPAVPDLKGVKTERGDYAKGELAGIMDSGTITGDAIKHYRLHADGKLCIAFCVSVAHSQHVAEQFRQAGIMAWHLDGNSAPNERRAAMDAFRRREIKVLTNVDLFGEGVDVPGVEAVSMLRPTQSLALYLQQCGRACRPAEGKTHAIILDHAGNVLRHGLPDEDREWTLEGTVRRRGGKSEESEIRVRQCPRCFMAHRPAPACPSCGYQYVATGREIEVKDGNLVEVDPAVLRAKRKAEERKARTFEELVALAEARGYRNPQKWASMKMTYRMAARERHIAEYAMRRGFLT